MAYVDFDPVVLAALRALAAQGSPGVTVVEGDAREIAVILDAVGAAIDLSEPACLLMGALLHFFPPDAARDLVAGYAAALAPGSYVVLSVGRADDNDAARGFGTYSSAGAPQVYNHSVAEFTSFFGPLALVRARRGRRPRVAHRRQPIGAVARPPRPGARRCGARLEDRRCRRGRVAFMAG